MVLRSVFTPVRYQSVRFADEPFTAIQRAVQRSLEDAWGHLPSIATDGAALAIRLDVKEDDKAFHVTADLPGLSETDVDVSFDDKVLTIRGEKKVERDEKKDTWHITERHHGSFTRQLSLPVAIQSDKIEARFDKGVLNITLPKAAPEQAIVKKIPIKTT